MPHRERRRAAGDQARRAARPFRGRRSQQFLIPSIPRARRQICPGTLAQSDLLRAHVRLVVWRKISDTFDWTHVGGEW